jgi:hypothetical protein
VEIILKKLLFFEILYYHEPYHKIIFKKNQKIDYLKYILYIYYNLNYNYLDFII